MHTTVHNVVTPQCQLIPCTPSGTCCYDVIKSC